VHYETVCRAEPKWAQQALAVLRRSGLAAEILDDPPLAVTQKSLFVSKVRVGVPEAESRRAQEVLQKWFAETERAAAPLGSNVAMSLAVVFGPPLAAWMVSVAMRARTNDWLLEASIVWVLATVAVIADAERRALRETDRSRGGS
jgi:hypothetical protein